MKSITTALLAWLTLLVAAPRLLAAEGLRPNQAVRADVSGAPAASPTGNTPVARPDVSGRNRLAPESTRSTPGDRLGRKRSTGTPVLTACSALAIVVGLFLFVAWLARRKLPVASHVLPEEVLEVLGRAPLAGRQDAHLVRLGRKLLLVCLSTSGAETLTEITDPEEVDRLAGLCKQLMPRSSTTSFRNMLQRVSREPAPPSFVGGGLRTGTGTARRTSQAREPSHV